MSQKKSGKGCFGCLTCLGAAVLVAGGAFFYFRVVKGSSLTPMTGAKVVPEEALMTAFISTEAKSWSQGNKFGTPEAQKLIGEGVENLSEGILASAELDYERDLQPWIGNVMVAWLPANSEAWTRNEDSLLVVVGIKNKLEAWNFAKKLKEGQEFKETKYKGITVFETKTGTEDVAAAILGNKLVLSSDPDGVESAIDTFKDSKSLARKEGAKKLLAGKSVVKNPIFKLYVPDYGELLQEAFAINGTTTELTPELLEQLAVLDSLGMGIGFEEQGLRLQVLTSFNPDALKHDFKPGKSQIISRFPAETFALVSGRELNKIWSEIVEHSVALPELEQALNHSRGLFELMNLDLDEDIFGWMNGEFALSMIGVNEGISRYVGIGASAIFQTSAPESANRTLAKLEDLAAQNSWIFIERRTVEGKTIVQWKTPPGEVLLSYGWLDNNSLTIAWGSHEADILKVRPKTSLAQSQNFKALTGSLPQKNFGYFYFDMAKATEAFKHYTELPPETRAILDSIRGIGATTTLKDNSTSELDLLLHLQPRN